VCFLSSAPHKGRLFGSLAPGILPIEAEPLSNMERVLHLVSGGVDRLLHPITIVSFLNQYVL
jgi:hypothetical protein